jgi:uncharacterized BrkB/YihY/UPF0761 family membrane protein
MKGASFNIAAEAASGNTIGIWTEIVSAVVLVVTASGAFGEIQSALNVVWKANAKNVSPKMSRSQAFCVRACSASRW